MQNSKLISNIIYLWKYLGRGRKKQFLLLFLLMMFSVIAEMVSIGSVVPFLSALTNPEFLMKSKWFQPFISFLDIDSKDRLLFVLTTGFIGAAVISGALRLTLLWVNSRISASMGIQLRTEVYEKTLYMPYSFHIENNSSQLISMVTEKVPFAIFASIMHVLMMTNSLIVSLAIIGTLIYINPFIALVTFTLLGGGYIAVAFLVKNKIKQNGEIAAKNQPIAIKCMQEGLGGIRDIIMDHSQPMFVDTYKDVASKIQLAGMRQSFLGGLPKPIIEVMSIVLIASLAYYLQTQSNNEQQVLPILGALALGAQRLLPSLQQVYFSWSTIHNYQRVIDEVVKQLKQNNSLDIDREKSSKPLKFEKNITLKDLSFSYKDSKNHALRSIGMTIKKGEKVGFIGKTGSGKSTLLDIIMGLLKPIDGYIEIDGVKIDKTNILSWQKNIAHVPQSIYLTDATILENIAFGELADNIDIKRVEEAAKRASLHEFIKELPEGYKTYVGERGVQLSGGQRQRIGIARALYKNASVIVFDEATSALDDATEKSVMEAINNLSDDLTILMIAHRLSTLKGCDVIYQLKNGKIIENGKYSEMIKNKDII